MPRACSWASARRKTSNLELWTEAGCEPAALLPAVDVDNQKDQRGTVHTLQTQSSPQYFQMITPAKSNESLCPAVAFRRFLNKDTSVWLQEGTRRKCENTARLKAKASRLSHGTFIAHGHCSAFPHSLSRTTQTGRAALPGTPFHLPQQPVLFCPWPRGSWGC